jgi:hypothetical protein
LHLRYCRDHLRELVGVRRHERLRVRSPSSTSRNASSDIPLAASRYEEKIRVGWSWRMRSRTWPNRLRSTTCAHGELDVAPAEHAADKRLWRYLASVLRRLGKDRSEGVEVEVARVGVQQRRA